MTSVHVFRVTPINSGEPPAAVPSSAAHRELQGLHVAMLILATAASCAPLGKLLTFSDSSVFDVAGNDTGYHVHQV